MNEKLRHDLVVVLEQAYEAMDVRDFRRLKRLSDHTIEDASIYQDDDSISAAVVMYTISKIVERVKKDTDYYSNLKELMNQELAALKDGVLEQYHLVQKEILKLIAEADNKLKLYVDEVLVKAQIKKSSKLYEHGISVSRAAEILSISQWELMSYIGKTNIHDFLEPPKDVESRIKFARSLFQ